MAERAGKGRGVTFKKVAHRVSSNNDDVRPVRRLSIMKWQPKFEDVEDAINASYINRPGPGK
jgi:hypothetical protein